MGMMQDDINVTSSIWKHVFKCLHNRLTLLEMHWAIEMIKIGKHWKQTFVSASGCQQNFQEFIMKAEWTKVGKSTGIDNEH